MPAAIVAILVANTRPLDPDYSAGVLAVYFFQRGTMAVIPEFAGPIHLWSLVVSVSAPCVMMLERDAKAPSLIEVAVSDPTQQLHSLSFTISGRNEVAFKCSASSAEGDTELTHGSAGGTIPQTTTVPLPAGERAGSSVQLRCVTESMQG